MSSRLANRVAIVTGGGRGIGRAISHRFAAEGAHVVIATRSRSAGEDACHAILDAGGQAELIVTDIGERTAIFNLTKDVHARHGRLDIIVHNAGYMSRGHLVDTAKEDLEHALAVNLLAGFHFLAAAHAYLEASPAGRLLFTSSTVASRQVQPGYGLYGTTKAALNGFIRQAAFEFAAKGITVNGVEPGLVATASVMKMPAEMLNPILASIPRGCAARPEDVAAALLFLASDDAAHITGQTIVVDGGQTLGATPPKQN